jgi:hypothetical protein
MKDGKPQTYYVYNVCDHEACYKEVGSQAISYTTGVPAMIGAMLMLKGIWKKAGVYTTDEFDPDPFMEELNRCGLPWKEEFSPVLLDLNMVLEELMEFTIDVSNLQTPCYLVDERLLERNLRILDSVQQKTGCSILLALKRVFMFSTFPLIGKYLAGLRQVHCTKRGSGARR